jgi:hypothetical protein
LERFFIFAIGILLAGPIWIHAQGDPPLPSEQAPDRGTGDRTFISFGGTEIGEDISSVRYIGQLVNRSGGAFGAYTHIGDINGDGRNDTVISALQTPGLQGMGEDGAVFIFFGKDEPAAGPIDLQNVEPDIRIRANTPSDFRAGRILTSQITAGDYNGDGRNDIALHTQRPLIYYAAPNPLKNHCMILFAPETGMPSTITLPDDEDLLRAIELEYCGPVSTAADVPMPYFMETSDLDRDGIDDIVFGGCMNNFGTERIWYLTIAWGGYAGSGHGPNLTYTILKNKDTYSSFGSSIDIGDIDGDGWCDLVVGSPQKTPESTGLYQSGTVHIYFNVSLMRGMGEIPFNQTEPKVIYGSGEYDRFGNCVILKDLNGDGFDDIIASAPEADGPSNADTNCGEIAIFYGGPEGSFPAEMAFEKDYDLLVLGPEGYTEEGGFKLGQMFRLGDLTGDGKADFVAGLMSKDLPPLSEGETVRIDCGITVIYDHESIFRNPTGMVRVGYPAKTFTVEGKDIEDMLGYYFSVGDIDGNGIEDLLMSAPYADGSDNARPRCGEVYAIYTSHLRLWDQTLSGPCYDKGTVFASQGPLTIDTIVMNERPDLPINNVMLEFGPSDMPIAFNCSSTGVSLTDPYGCIDPVSIAVVMPERSKLTLFKISFEIGWFFPERDGIDIAMTLRDEEGCILHRHYRDVFDLAKDLSFGDGQSLTSNGIALPGSGSWLGMGEPIEIGGVAVVYRGHPEREVDGSDIDVIVGTSRGNYEIPYSSDWSFSDHVRDAPVQEYALSMGLAGRPVPMTPDLMPLLDSGHRITVKVDDVVPSDPAIASMTPPSGGGPEYGRPGSWALEIDGSLGANGDPDGSGVRHFIVTDSGGTFIASEGGGLWGTYYSDLELGDIALNITDPTVDFEWGKWGPHPETFTMPPYGFSARWHGWISVDVDSSVRFQLAGRGLGMMMLDGEIHIPYDDLEYAPKGTVMDLTGGERHEVILYYRHAETNKTPSFRFQWIDPEGKLSPVPSTVLYHPSIRTNVTVTGTDPEVSIVAVDWVGLRSGAAIYRAEVDPNPPLINVTGIPHWTRTLDPVIEFSITDQGSGIDRDSIFYRLLRDGEGFGTWTTDGLIYTARAGDLSWLNLSLDLTLDRDYSGTLEIIASDLSGNLARTPPIHIAHDRSAPAIEMVYPRSGALVRATAINASFTISDMNGSGVDRGSVMVRYRMDAKEWEVSDLPMDQNADGSATSFMMHLRSGFYELEVSVDDLVGNHAVLRSNFTVDIPPVNEPPIVSIRDPANNSKFFVGSPFILSASGTRDDGLGGLDPIRLSWFSNRTGYLGSGMSLKVTLMDIGEHLITLYADDGEHNVSAGIKVRILARQDPEPGGGDGPERDDRMLEILIAAIIVVLLILITTAAIAMRRRDSRTPYPEE